MASLIVLPALHDPQSNAANDTAAIALRPPHPAISPYAVEYTSLLVGVYHKPSAGPPADVRKLLREYFLELDALLGTAPAAQKWLTSERQQVQQLLSRCIGPGWVATQNENTIIRNPRTSSRKIRVNAHLAGYDMRVE